MTRQITPPSPSISTIAIRRYIGTFMLTLAVIVVGFFYITQLPVDLLPSITYPRIGLRMDAAGISPEVAVDEITRPLEQGLSATEGVVQVFSQTREGRISINLYFEPGEDIDQALNDATAALNRTLNRLPEGLETPRLFKYDPSQLPVYEFALTSPTLADVDLRVFADEELARELNVIPGVASVDVSGGVREEVRVNVDLDRLQSLGVGLNEVLTTLRERNQDISGGRLVDSPAEPLTRTVGRFKTAGELRNLAFDVGNGRVYLRDFAEVIDGTEEQRVLVNLNSNPAVKVSVQKQPDANTIAVVDAVKAKIAELRNDGTIAENMEMTTTLDESVFIRQSIANVATAGISGAALAGCAVLLFLGSLRQTFIIVLAIPLATLMAIILMGLFGLSLNVFSLGGLALGVGIVVDNAIVMLENIARAYERRDRGSNLGASPLAIAENSSRELESALVASTTTNLVSVLPFLLIGGFLALLFGELILTISFAVAASLIVALTVVPMLSSRLLSIRRSSGVSRLWLLRGFDRTFEAITGLYQNVLGLVLRYRLIFIACAIVALGGTSIQLAGQIPQEILPRINTGQARLFAQFPPGTTLETNQKVMREVDRILLEQPETEYVFTSIGGFLFGNTTSANLLRSSATITLKPGTNVAAFSDRLGKEFDQLNLVDIRLRVSPESVRGLILNNSPVRADIDIALTSEDLERLDEAAKLVLDALDERVTLAQFRPDADQPQPEVQILPDWERVAEAGLSAEEIGDTIQTAILGSVPTQLQRDSRLVDIRVQLARSSVRQASQLSGIPLFTGDRRPIRLGDVARIETGQAPGEIQRINQRQVFLIAGSLAEGASLGDALAEVDAVLAEVELPPGVRILPSSAAESSQELQRSLVVLGLLATFLVFVTMAVHYNSLVDPFVIILTVPLALSGGIVGLYVTHTAVGATAIVGAILLVGIVVNNAIVLVELANQICDRQEISRRQAILQAAPQRLRPIMMTTVTTVLGLLPLALGVGEGSEFLQPLGVVVFWGLSLATILTLFLIPCFYTLVHEGFIDKPPFGGSGNFRDKLRGKSPSTLKQ
ncbi:efflux RND transporter permease subunit [Oxynema aestuarii]|uniref:Efflux RND transporter permease subunit n=1 Tax=Oxynema aestuarii AP17 TaxID=2064643 RepID=A0A6H1U2E5_9CYAN|nr:efflux RND transporter permease subunit [Oxynema aestuarii]QIZ72825.1 efflux RND transporter permease subunit [Oxynema aestuarii AP17]